MLEIGGPFGAAYFCYKCRKSQGKPAICFEDMDKLRFEQVLAEAASCRGCSVYALDFDDDDNVFDVTLDKAEGDVTLEDCEYVHRALLDAFDRDVEDYSLTVGSVGLSPEEADKALLDIKD